MFIILLISVIVKHLLLNSTMFVLLHNFLVKVLWIMYKRIEWLCKKKNITITEMCRRANVSRAILSDYKFGRSKSIGAPTLSKIATYLGVSTDYLLGLTDKENAPQSPAEERDAYPEPVIKFVDILMKLPPEKQTEIVNYMEFLLSKNPQDKK